VDTRGPAQEREVCSIIHDHVSPAPCRDPHNRVAQIEETVRTQVLAANLQATRAAIEKRTREVGRLPAGATGNVDIDDGVKRR
jgi:hypothetical protein